MDFLIICLFQSKIYSSNHVVMFTQSWGYWVLNRLRKIGNYWVLNLEYSISSNSELILSAQKVNISYYNIEYTISLNSEHQLSTQYLNFLCNYWVYNFVWTLNCEHIYYGIEYTISINSDNLLSAQLDTTFIFMLSTQYVNF